MNSRIGVAALALVSFLNTGFPEEPRRVGESCDPSQVVYRGLETYSAKKITAELNRHPDYLLASHPFAPLPGLLSFIERNVRAGLRHTGFPDAKVAVQVRPGSKQTEVTVSEGPRYLCDDVVVSGLRNLPEGSVKAGLAEPRRPPPYRSPTDTDSGKPDPPIWEKGSPAEFAENSLKRLHKNVRQVLSELGCFFPEFEVQVVRKEQAKTADLLVRVKDEGPNGVIGEIKISGARVNTPQEIIDYLELRVGDRINSVKLDGIQKRLWDSGRFWSYTVQPKPREDGSERVDLIIQVTELRRVPSLFRPLSDTANAILKFREWALGAPGREEDFVVSGQRPPDGSKEGTPEDSFKVVISPRRGFLFRLNATLSQDGDAGPTPLMYVDFSLAATVDGVLFYWGGRDTKLESPDVPFAVTNNIHLLPNPKKEPEFALTFAFGVKGGREIRPDETPYILSLRIAPSALVSKAYDTGRRMAPRLPWSLEGSARGSGQ